MNPTAIEITAIVVGSVAAAFPLAWCIVRWRQIRLFRRIEQAAKGKPLRRPSSRPEYREGEGFTCGTAPDDKVRRTDTAVPRTRKGSL